MSRTDKKELVTVKIKGEVTSVYCEFYNEFKEGVIQFKHNEETKELEIIFYSPKACFDWAYELGYWRYTSPR